MSRSHQINPEDIRRNVPGYIGGSEIADKATDKEVIQLTKLQDSIGRLHNHIRGLQQQRDNLQEAIRARSLKKVNGGM